MSEDKNIEEKKNTEETKAEKPAGKVEAGKSDKPAESGAGLFDKEEKMEKFTVGALEELPEDIKKKLEQKKQERAKNIKKKKKKKVRKNVTIGKAFVKATYNNTMVTLTDMNGNVLSWASAGIAGFKGPKKSTPYAAQIITRIAVERAREQGLQEVSVFVKGVGTGRESAVRALNANGLNVISIKDVTPVPHNGCRAKKPRRV